MKNTKLNARHLDRAKRREVFIIAFVVGFCFPSGFFCNMVKDKNNNDAITEPIIQQTIEVSTLFETGAVVLTFVSKYLINFIKSVILNFEK